MLSVCAPDSGAPLLLLLKANMGVVQVLLGVHHNGDSDGHYPGGERCAHRGVAERADSGLFLRLFSSSFFLRF